jgi:hypothetical protein
VHVNSLAMPWECLFCPKAAKKHSGRPKIWNLAQELRDLAPSEFDGELDAQRRWLTQDPPSWAARMVDGGDPTSAEDAPPSRYFLRTALDVPEQRS